MSAFMAQAGHLVVCGDAGPDLGDSIYEAVLYVRGKVASLGADCVEQPMTEADRATLDGPAGAGRLRARRRRLPALRLGAPAVQLPRRPCRQLLGERQAGGWHGGRSALVEESASFPPGVIAEIQRAAREGLYEIRGFGAKRRAAELRRPRVPRRLDLALSARGLPREVRDRRHDRHALRRAADRARDPDHDRRHELRRARRERQGGARPRRDRDGHQHDDRRRRHDRRGARGLEDAGLPGAAVALRPQPGRPAPRRRDRDRGRAGRQARRRRHAARPEDHRAGRRDAHAAAGHRPAQRLPPSRLDRPRRPHDQDRRAARDHRLAEADLRQDRRDAARSFDVRARGQGRAPTRSCSTACRAAPARPRTCSSSTSASRPCRRSARRSRRCRSWTCTARCS